MTGPSGRGGRRRQILQDIEWQLEKWNGSDAAFRKTNECDVENYVVADLDTQTFADSLPVDWAKLRVQWYITMEGSDHFKVTYSDSEGFECSWCRQYNNEVSGTEFFRQRESEESDFSYEETQFPSNHATVIHDIIHNRLPDRVGNRY